MDKTFRLPRATISVASELFWAAREKDNRSSSFPAVSPYSGNSTMHVAWKESGRKKKNRNV